MLIVPWDPFLMKKLLRSEICGSVNTVHRKSQIFRLKKKKKKKEEETQNVRLGSTQTHP